MRAEDGPASAETAPLRRGDRARIAGLAASPALNGTDVTLLKWIPAAQRWAVRCDGTGQVVRVRPVHLEPPPDEIDGAAEAAAPAAPFPVERDATSAAVALRARFQARACASPCSRDDTTR